MIEISCLLYSGDCNIATFVFLGCMGKFMVFWAVSGQSVVSTC